MITTKKAKKGINISVNSALLIGQIDKSTLLIINRIMARAFSRIWKRWFSTL
jgi:hypothetical protein